MKNDNRIDIEPMLCLLYNITRKNVIHKLLYFLTFIKILIVNTIKKINNEHISNC